MEFYNRDNIKYNFDNMQYLSHGSCAEVFFDEKNILKKYFWGVEQGYRIDVEMFDLLKEFKNPHFIELHDIYTKYAKIEIVNKLFKKMRKNKFWVFGYSAKYYKDDNIDVLNTTKEYFLDNLREIEKLINELAKNGVLICDMKRQNAILNKDNIVIIDPDLFYLYYSRNSYSINKLYLFELFDDILLECISKSFYLYDTNKYLQEKINFKRELSSRNLDLPDNLCITDEFSRQLKYVKKPAELFSIKK